MAAPLLMTAIVVTAALVERGGCFLVTRRQKGVHREGYGEFPGGKCEPGESLAACLARELREELDVGTIVGAEIFTTTHAYPERSVELHFLRCTIDGEPRSILGQEIRWVPREDLESLPVPPPAAELIALLRDAPSGGGGRG